MNARPAAVMRIAIAVCAFAASIPAVSAKEPIDIGTPPQGSIFYGAAAAMAQVFYEKGGIRARIQPNSGGGSLIPQVNNGELDLGISAIGEVGEAYQGMDVFEGRPQSNLRVVAVLFPVRSAIFVRKSSDIHTISDLRGKRLTAGFKAMHALDGILDAVLANGGVGKADVHQVMVPNVIRGAEDFMTGRADAFFFGVGSAKVLEVDATVGGVRVLPLETTPEAMTRMQERFEYGYSLREEPGPASAGVAEPLYVLAYDNLLLTNADVSNERIGEILDLLTANKDELSAMSAQFRRFSRDKMYKTLPLPYHPGAVAWYEAQNIQRAPLQ